MTTNNLTMPTGRQLPRFGLGTWHMGERTEHRRAEVAALRHGVENGATLIDTAEMYGEGAAEEIVAEAITGYRDNLTLVSKVYPHNGSVQGVQDACERSLTRLATDRIDLYLLHWPGSIALEETLEGFARLQEAGKIRDHGVSNFDADDLARWHQVGGTPCTNQILYNLNQRQAEWATIPWCRKHAVPVMAYCPLDQGGPMLEHETLREVAAGLGATPAQVALAWLLQRDGTVVIPKSSNRSRVSENLKARELYLQPDDLGALDAAFPPPSKPVHLGMR